MAHKRPNDHGRDRGAGKRSWVAVAALLAVLTGGRAESAPPAATVAAPAAATAAPAVAETPPKIARDVRIIGDNAHSRLVVDLSESVDVVVFTLADPYRVVIDLPGVAFSLPPGVGQTGRGLVTGYRYGQVAAAAALLRAIAAFAWSVP